jgi:hypothetical protein
VSCVGLHLSFFAFQIPKFIRFTASPGEVNAKMAEFEYVNHADATETKGPRPPLDFSYHYSRVTAARKESSVKSFYKYFQIPGIGNLAGGMFGTFSAIMLTDISKSIPFYATQTENNAKYIDRTSKCQSVPIRHPRSPNSTAPKMETYSQRPQRSKQRPFRVTRFNLLQERQRRICPRTSYSPARLSSCKSHGED